MVRDYSAKFQIFKTLSALSNLENLKLLNFADAMGILQHHDAVTGTAKQHVTFDYQKRLHAGYTSAAKGALSQKTWAALGLHDVGPEGLSECVRRNETVCAATTTSRRSISSTSTDAAPADHLEVVLWNNLARGRLARVEIPVPALRGGQRYKLMLAGMEEAVLQTTDYVGSDGSPHDVETGSPPLVAPVEATIDVTPAFFPSGNYGPPKDGAKWLLSAEVELPALGFRTARIEVVKRTEADVVMKTSQQNRNVRTAENKTAAAVEEHIPFLPYEDIPALENAHLKLTFCSDGSICGLQNKDVKLTVLVKQTWRAYASVPENAIGNSGAYVFRPDANQKPVSLAVASIAFVKGENGPVEVRQTFKVGGASAKARAYVSQRVRLVGAHVEIVHTTGPVPDQTEIVSHWGTDLGKIETDVNGRQMLERKWDSRDWPHFENTDKVGRVFWGFFCRSRGGLFG